MFTQEKGYVLITTLIFLVLLTLFGIWVLNQGTTSLKISSALKQYFASVNLADSGSNLGLRAIAEKKFDSPNLDPNLAGKITSNIPVYLASRNFTIGNRQVQLINEIDWKGYDPEPLPGWSITKTNKNFYTQFLDAKSTGKYVKTNSTVIFHITNVVPE